MEREKRGNGEERKTLTTRKYKGSLILRHLKREYCMCLGIRLCNEGGWEKKPHHKNCIPSINLERVHDTPSPNMSCWQALLLSGLHLLLPSLKDKSEA